MTAQYHLGYLKGFEGAFIFPALLAIIVAIIAFFLVRDTPQSQGLPPIEVYKDDYRRLRKKHLKLNSLQKIFCLSTC